MDSRIGRRGAMLGGAALLAAPAARAQGFPTRPVRFIVPYPPGGVTDIVARLVAEPLGRQLGQPVVVENRPGAGGNIGAMAAASAEPDGYTLFLGTMATQGVNPVIYPDARVNPARDFVGVGTIADMPNVLDVNPRRLEAKSVAELIEQAKRRRGELIYGSVGNGSSSHLSSVMFLRAAGIDAVHVPYRGSSPAVTALLAGEVDWLFDTTATSVPHIRAGAFRALAVTMNRRSAALPEVPTMEEAGLPGYHLSVWTAVFTQARVAAPVLARLREAFDAAMDAALQERLKASFVDPLVVPAAELPGWLAAESARWERIARESGIRAD